MDGFDVQAMGYAAPYLVKEWHVASGAMTAVFVATNCGVLVGAIAFSLLADRIGRRPVIVGATLFFGTLTVLAARATTLDQLFWLRFAGGVGLGAVIPNATALIGEFSPPSRRVPLMMRVSVAFTIGGALGGLIAAWLIPLFGWQSVFYFGGGLPLVTGAVMLAALPESPQFLAVHRRQLDRLVSWLNELDPQLRADGSTQYALAEEPHGGLLAFRLFDDGRALVTPLLWIVNFMNLLNLYALSNWLATVVNGMGYPQRTAVLVSTVLQVGGTVGTFGLAAAIVRYGFPKALVVSFAAAALTIGLIGQPGLPLLALFVVVFVAGWCIIGSQPGLNALSATVYPTYLRSTGVGWGLGIGRLGAIAGPYIGGMLIANHWTTEQMFVAAAAPALVSVVAMATLGRALQRHSARAGRPHILPR
jgi:AAHS family 4-hydroxybenzoate transporter-like MFS transporter